MTSKLDLRDYNKQDFENIKRIHERTEANIEYSKLMTALRKLETSIKKDIEEENLQQDNLQSHKEQFNKLALDWFDKQKNC